MVSEMAKFPLMRGNFSRSDLDAVIAHLNQNDPILTNGPNCRMFEKEWRGGVIGGVDGVAIR